MVSCQDWGQRMGGKSLPGEEQREGNFCHIRTQNETKNLPCTCCINNYCKNQMHVYLWYGIIIIGIRKDGKI